RTSGFKVRSGRLHRPSPGATMRLLPPRPLTMTPTLLLAAMLATDPTPAEQAKADEAIHKYLTAETERLGKKFLDGATTKAEWEAKRPRLNREFLDMLRLDPLPEKTPPKATVTGTLERGDVVSEKLHYQSRPGRHV